MKSEEAIRFIKENKHQLIDTFINKDIYKPRSAPFTIFMAGSPGAGKTETSKSLIKRMGEPVVRIDADEVRDFIPQYNGKNSDEVQGAAALGVQKLYDYIIEKRIDCLLDGTFANYDVSRKNVERCIRHNRLIEIFYIYQDPVIAWDFTKKRERIEGRVVPKNTFVQSFFNAWQNVNEIKGEFKEKVKINLITKDFQNGTELTRFNIEKIDNYINLKYDKATIESKLIE